MGFLKNFFGKRSGVSPAINTNFNQVSEEDWNPLLRPPDSQTRYNSERWVARCRSISEDDSYGFGIVTTFHENVVTSKGIQIQNASDDQEFAQVIDAAWRGYSESKDASLSGKLNLIAMQKQAVTALLSDGELFLRKHFTKDGFQFELIDPVRIPYALLTRARGGTRYRNGILVDDATGKVLAYKVDDVGSDNYRLGATISEGRGHLVPADEMLHVAIKRRIDQSRGTPLLRAVAGRLWKISSYENAVIENAASAAQKWGFFKWDKDSESPPDLKLEFKPSKTKSGSFIELPSGLDVDSYSSQFPDGELGDFIRAILLSVSKSIGVSYPTLSGDLTSVNYASIRQAVLAERQAWGNLAMFLLMELILPIYEAFFMDLLAAGKLMVGRRTLSLMDMPAVMNIETASVMYPEIDPKAEHGVETGRIQNLLLSPSAAIRSRGGDPEMVWKDCAKDIKAMQEAGIPEEYIHNLFLKQTFAIESLADAKILEGE